MKLLADAVQSIRELGEDLEPSNQAPFVIVARFSSIDIQEMHLVGGFLSDSTDMPIKRAANHKQLALSAFYQAIGQTRGTVTYADNMQGAAKVFESVFGNPVIIAIGGTGPYSSLNYIEKLSKKLHDFILLDGEN